MHETTLKKMLLEALTACTPKMNDEDGEPSPRLDAGAYGTCDDCGEAIGLARLMASPATSLCVHCQAERERTPQFRCA